MTDLYLYDDAQARQFEPYSLTRPLSEMRAGVALLRERWERVAGIRVAGMIAADHLADFDELGSPGSCRGTLPAGSLVANSRCVVSLGTSLGEGNSWQCAGRVAALRLQRDVSLDEFRGGDVSLDELVAQASNVVGTGVQLAGRWLAEVWSFITDLAAQLNDDIGTIGPKLTCFVPEGSIRIGALPVFIERGANIEPSVCLDTTAGPILVCRGATVRAFTRLVGPCAIASGSTVLGGRVAACSIGEHSVVHGEISESVVLGYANKAHDGFVGHSYIGRWANLGAGTITSNLKNTYGSVSLWTPSGFRDTGVTKLGTFFGDHVKTGIGLRLTTGSVLGAGSNVYGNAMPPKSVPAFSWGEGDNLGTYEMDKFLETARRAMSRRDVRLTERALRQFRLAHDRARAEAAGGGR
ncbi:MAG: putative sugar nucleotidyl transferase [Gemmatimonadaceae bacterium]